MKIDGFPLTHEQVARTGKELGHQKIPDQAGFPLTFIALSMSRRPLTAVFLSPFSGLRFFSHPEIRFCSHLRASARAILFSRDRFSSHLTDGGFPLTFSQSMFWPYKTYGFALTYIDQDRYSLRYGFLLTSNHV